MHIYNEGPWCICTKPNEWEEYNRFVPWEEEVLRPIGVYGVLSQPYTTNHTVYIVFQGIHCLQYL